jgi:hypothetical protein
MTEDIKRDCETCARPGTPGGICTLSGMDLATCLGNPSRPFWRPKSKKCDTCEADREKCVVGYGSCRQNEFMWWRPKSGSCSRRRENKTRRPDMTQIELTPKQIKEIDEIRMDKDANNQTLNIALSYHSNRQTRIRKKEKAWWDDMIQTHDLDPSTQWMVDFKSPVLHIREADEDEKE